MNILALLAGTLCVLANGKLTNCTSTTDALIKLQPAAESRRVVWTSDDGKRLALAMLPANAETFDVGKLHDVALRVAGDPSRGWPADLRIGFGRDIAYVVPAKSVSKLTTLSLPPAHYTLTFAAEHHVTAVRKVDLATQPRVDAGDIRLRPLPLLTGTVVTTKDGKDVPLSGADVSFSMATRWLPTPHLATTDDKGSFRAELPERPAPGVVISHAGVGSKTIRLDRTDADANLGTIRLLPGIRLTVHVVRPPELRKKPLTVTLFRNDPQIYEPTRVASRELAPSDDDVVFGEATVSKQFVVVQGEGPLARISVPVTIDEEKPTGAEVRIEPYTLTGHLTFGGDPLGGAQFEVYPSDQMWRTNVTVAADGSFNETAWQHGILTGALNDSRIGSFYFADSPELGADPSVWNYDVKKRLITGRVYDAATNEPMANLYLFESVSLRGEHGPLTGGSSVRTDASGNFKVLTAFPGHYELRVTHPDYAPMSKAFDIADDDGSKTADFPLEHGVTQPLVLHWPDGAPVANATLYDGDAPSQGQLPPTYRSDATGTALIHGKSGEDHKFYVMPVEGSIAVVRLTIAGGDAKPVEAVVGRPTGALRIVAVDPDGKPSGGAVIFTLNGELVPLEMVMRRYGPTAGFDKAGERVLDRLPAGTYEVWVTRSWTGTQPAQPAARVGISAGEERVQVVVPKR